MRTLVTILVMAVVLCPLTASATIINIPGDYPTIQEGIDHGQDGDTVLVQPDIYYENLNFNGHNITLASLFLTTGDTSYISTTIIDGDSAGSVITFSSGEDSTAQVVGFTIQNGDADLGGGIYCQIWSSPTISNNTITGNSADSAAGGICCHWHSNPTISNNSISANSTLRGGGICCQIWSSPTISNNTITGNSADSTGGGILCHWYSSPTISNNSISANSAGWGGGGGISCRVHCTSVISNNTFTGNSARDGGGISCMWYARPTISNNTFSGNSAKVGGGISCRVYSYPVISSNTFSDNSADVAGGGISCIFSHPTISNNTLTGNSAGLGGGMLFSDYADPTISNNTITGNSADSAGGGIVCYHHAHPTISNNTITGNSAGELGGGISCHWESTPTITNTILWGDTAPNGPEIYVEGANPTFTYCDVQGGWEGEGNIDVDPIFVGPYNEDFQLRWRSPCIDAGVPDSLDPDGTRSDIGAFYFNQDVDGIVEVYPLGEPIVIPPEGGDITYDGWVFNFFGHSGRADIWTYAFVPGMGQYGPLDLYENVRIPADSLGKNEMTLHVPGDAPGGDYVFVAYAGDYPSTIIDSSYFYFSKTGSIVRRIPFGTGGIADWFEGTEWFKEISPTESNLPTDYALSQNYPNPFNATTTINYQVPVDGYVKLEVYNTLGQKVQTLVDERQEAGYKSIIWDASEVSSGLYFYNLTAGDFTETRRMMLVK